MSGDSLIAWRDGVVVASAIAAAHTAMLRGGVVGMPTETVYGLAARARDEAAVSRVFAIKGRPLDHPVIVHLADAGQISDWAVDVPVYAQRLALALWPGPLTLVLPAARTTPRYLTGGQDTVGLRCPAHPVALALLDRVGPVAAPSANRFGRVSPVTAADVAELDLGPHDLVLDGGPCPVGIESTILDCSGSAPRILRWGAVELADISTAGGVAVDAGASSVRAPGGLASHYAPHARVVVDGRPYPGAGLLALADVPTPPGVVRVAAPASTREFAACLYRALRDADALGLESLHVMTPEDNSALSTAIRDRVNRAAAAS